MLIHESLEKYGLSSKESRVYLACLELGNTTVQEIAKKAELPRSTTYSVLESLINQKLAFSLKGGKVMRYSAEDPQKIMNLSEEATRSVKSSLPELKILYKSAKGRPKIKYHEGLPALKEMYNDILRTKGLKEYLIISPEATWIQMDEPWFEEFKKRRATAKIRTKLILSDNPAARQRQKDGGKYLSEVKIMPDNLSFELEAGAYIFHNKVIYSEYKKDLIAVEIFSKGIADMQRLMFDNIWNSIE